MIFSSIIFLCIAVCIGVYHWFYIQEVKKLNRHFGLLFPKKGEQLLKAIFIFSVCISLILTVLVGFV